ncbi:TetR/AcrR family transcriptional regulator [Jiella avicenniae]|uniref:TetR/AcrR family transcriptional regulator n=1 Tax=Jiella avicenniae TaxID=2907202 RepID=A0A9X1NXN3_9HYPH|nr:TetR/AcrR family transcriptional regulator [Jiella avicenniae]MCE7027615.1 TetR/AcrR family transcriptional regulator [Jiella avicenniae]MCE7028657.1 TetR/AcrR family transcriptional regulator [Jiella avicenniae]
MPERERRDQDRPRRRPPRRERDFAAIRGGEDAALRRRILAAAAEIFAARGYAAASIDEVAKSLGATKGLVYHRYRSKGELLADLCEDGLARLAARTDEIAGRRERAIARLTEAANVHSAAVLADIALHRTLAGATSGMAIATLGAGEAEAIAGIAERRRRYDAIFTRLIAEAVEERDLPTGRDTAMLGRIFVTALDAPILWPHDTIAELADRRGLIARQLAYFALRGIGASDTTLREEFSR